MHVPARWALGVPLGGFAIVSACTLEGAHIEQLFAAGPTTLVLGIAVASFLAGRGVTASRRLLRALGAAPPEPEQRLAVIADVARLERGALCGAGFGVLWAASDAIGDFRTPMHIGPSLAFALQCLAVATVLSAFVWLPLRQHLLPGPSPRLPARAAWSRVLAVGGIVALLAAAPSATLPGVPQTPLLAPTTLLLIAGTVLPSLLAAPRAIVGSQVAAARAGWLADSLCCAGVLAVTSGVAHCFSILDQPSLLAPGLAFVAASFAIPILAGTLVRLYGSPGDADASSTVATSSPHPAFVAVVMATLVGMVAFVGVVLQQGVAG